MTTRWFSYSAALFSCLSVLACDDTAKPDKDPPEPAPVIGKADPAPPVANVEPEVAASTGPDAGAEETGPVDPPDTQPVAAVRPTLTFADEATKAKAAELAKERDGKEFPRELVKPVDNAVAFLHLAHTAEDPGLTAAALYAVATRYNTWKNDRYRMVDYDYHAVVAYRLQSTNNHILAAAFEAAEHSMSDTPSDPAVTEILLKHATEGDNLVVRHLALDALRHAKKWTGPIQDAFVHALKETSPEFLALALDALTYGADKLVDQEAAITKFIEFTKHPHEAVRGQAVETLCGVRYDDAFRDRVGKVVAPMLDDDSAFVRAQSVHCAAVLRRLALAGKIVAMLEDDGSAAFRVDKWTDLDGAANRALLLTPGGGTVGSSGLMALSIMSNETDEKFESHKHVVRDDEGGKDLGPAIVAAKAWYAAHKTELDAAK